MSRLPAAVLYVCSLNRVRSPMAAGLTRRIYGDAIQVESSGLRPTEDVDPMAAVVMQEMGVEMFDHQPRSFDDVSAETFGLIVALSADAWEAVKAASGPEVEYWDVGDPTVEEGSREMRLEAYRQTRRDLEARIVRRFGPPAEWE